MCLVNELARFNRIQPQYKLLNEKGPAHAKVCQCEINRTFGMKSPLSICNYEKQFGHA